jgi:hypothetical protein
MRFARSFPLLLLAAIVSMTACAEAGARSEPAGAPDARVEAEPAPDSALVRFQATVADTPSTLAGGETSREGLIAAFDRAIAEHDTAALRRLHVDRGEFAFLYYPGSEHSRRPLYQAPEVLWFRYRLSSEKGIGRVLERLGGAALGVTGHVCRDAVSEGGHRLHRDCRVRRVVGADTVEHRLFGSIVEREGRFKFLTYSNDY